MRTDRERERGEYGRTTVNISVLDIPLDSQDVFERQMLLVFDDLDVGSASDVQVMCRWCG